MTRRRTAFGLFFLLTAGSVSRPALRWDDQERLSRAPTSAGSSTRAAPKSNCCSRSPTSVAPSCRSERSLSRPGANSGNHLHGATEVFYVLEGELEHVVDGVSQILGPGDLGFVRPPSEVNHITSPDGPPVRLW